VSVHDRCCPLDDGPEPCVICEAISKARGEEKATFNATWKANLPLIVEDRYRQGYRDAAEGREARW